MRARTWTTVLALEPCCAGDLILGYSTGGLSKRVVVVLLGLLGGLGPPGGLRKKASARSLSEDATSTIAEVRAILPRHQYFQT